MKNPRLQAAELLARVLQDRDSLASLPVATNPEDSNTVALVRELCLGVCRHYTQLDLLLGQLLEKPLRNKDADIRALLLTGLYQLFYMRVPDHAALNETVSCVRKPWAKGLVNAVLRNALRRYPDFPAGFSDSLSFRFSHPDWLVERLAQDWPDYLEPLLTANNERPPLTLRVNLQRSTREHLLAALAEQGVLARAGRLSSTAVVLDTPQAVTRLPGFEAGWFSVQDEASQLVPDLLDLRPGLSVLDACAAPGGKTCALLEREPALRMTALDNEPRRLERMRANLQRLQLEDAVTLVPGDASTKETLPESVLYDRILLDAPCSATGVIRRHPDIKVLRRPEQVGELADRQSGLLNALWDRLAPDGLLLYTTCSVLRQENSDQCQLFLDRHPDAREVALDISGAIRCQVGLQLLPGSLGQDGFYYALLQKC